MTKLDQLKNLMRTCLEANNRKSTYITVDRKDLKTILLETGGCFTIIINATVKWCNIKNKHLGAGVYNVWCEYLGYGDELCQIDKGEVLTKN